ncbi:type VI secretion system protein ImpG [Atopomonas hussainii]|uniref:Type VI secretion system protein ImpG n=1 Tax=Atopomonas hussainii TaxID=1429083 RepID=A0A1H7NTZ8_9GAMM|nr:type VI secretion system baseplate subunit TssF [Atopomonas hussainii]SEL26784.1 type VI secretion system protein ImpG [Atopomonas hussainii]
MAFNSYYQSEISALRQLGKRFSERSPALAPFLGQGSHDPDVERLLEGFAFLTGRLRQKLDDELPELTHSLMQLLWPNYMRPLPAFSMLQFEPLKHSANSVPVTRHTMVEAKPHSGVRCQFRTCYQTQVHALAATQLDYAVQGDGALMRLRLMMSADGQLSDIGLSNLRLHFAGERFISQMLYLALLRNLSGINVQLLDGEGKPLDAQFRLRPEQVLPVGFDEDDALMPYPLNTFRGYRLLQEYYAFQDKFLFVDVEGLERLNQWPEAVQKAARGFELTFDICKATAYRIRPTLDNVRLYCTPVVNLFAHDALPIRMDGKQDEYLLLPAEHKSEHCGVFAVERVTGWRPGGLGYEEYVPFESFEHDPASGAQRSRPYYSVRQRPSLLDSSLDTYLSFSQRPGEQHETISIELTCTNQNLPRQLAVGDICLPSEDTPEFLRFRNIIPATAHYAPPLNRDFLWKLISNMSLNYLSLADVEALRVILQTYDFPRYYDQHAERISRRQLSGLKGIQHKHVDRLLKGLPVRGVRTELQMDQECFIGEGDLFLFASVLNEFFALYASLNSYHELRVHSEQGEEYAWTPRMGMQPIL